MHLLEACPLVPLTSKPTFCCNCDVLHGRCEDTHASPTAWLSRRYFFSDFLCSDPSLHPGATRGVGGVSTAFCDEGSRGARRFRHRHLLLKLSSSDFRLCVEIIPRHTTLRHVCATARDRYNKPLLFCEGYRSVIRVNATDFSQPGHFLRQCEISSPAPIDVYMCRVFRDFALLVT